MSIERIVEGVERREPAALARAISLVENQRDGFERLLSHVHAGLGRGTARRIGVTGPPGAGKSTLTERLIQRFRARQLGVGVVAVDPTSPFTGGALLGDRIRMESTTLDSDVFIRSMATRGSHGGLATTTEEVADLLEAFGFERILIETVGVGQTELDIARTAETTVLVLVPESGDGIQTLKAGVMEIADIYVINKSDRPGGDRLRHEVEVMLGLRRGDAFRHMAPHPARRPPAGGRVGGKAGGGPRTERPRGGGGAPPHRAGGRLGRWVGSAGSAGPNDPTRRYKFLLDRGQTGLSVAFDFPTLMGYDSDHPRAEGEVGKCGVAISSLADMDDLFRGIPLDQVSTSMTINGPAAMLFCFYVAAAEKQGVPTAKLQGTVQNDMLKEYMAQHAWIYPVEPALKIIVDVFEWAAAHAPLWNTISISGYHIREAGATAAQELAFTLANGFTYVERGIARGLEVDRFAPRLSFFWDIHNDFFEEIAKLRAARRIWARHMRDRYGAKTPRSWMMRFHCQTAGVTLTAQQPLNNVVRVAYQALAAVLGGTQSLHTDSLDETLALPTEEAVRLALRTQQIIAHETGVPEVIDPLGGSSYVESLTDQLEREAEALFAEIQSIGGVVKGIESGWVQRQIARSAEAYQREGESGNHVIVGVNDFVSEDDHPVEILKVSNDAEDSQRRRLGRLRAERDAGLVQRRLDALTLAAESDQNVIGPMLDCARAYCTLYEIRHALERVHGAYREPVFF